MEALEQVAEAARLLIDNAGLIHGRTPEDADTYIHEREHAQALLAALQGLDDVWRGGWLQRLPRRHARGEGDAVSDHIPDTGKMVERLARAICRETCAFYGDPPCWQIVADNPDELDWPNRECDEPGCMALAQAAHAIIAEPPADG